MKIPIYYLDAFSKELFSGNPAAVIFSDIDDTVLMQQIAAENNLSETAFIKINDDGYFIRWFAPNCEIDLCGHASLASAYVYFKYIDANSSKFIFNSKKYKNLCVTKENNLLFLDFPSDNLIKKDNFDEIEKMIGVRPLEIFKGRDDYLVILDSQQTIENLSPDFTKLEHLNSRGLIATSSGNDCDFVSRCFFPKTGVNEDPVTGSAHTSLVPYWAKVQKKKTLFAKQLSSRGGELYCRYKENRVQIGGNVCEYLKGHISLKF